MELSPDEVAGVVDLFGALTREELDEVLAELAYRAAGEAEPAALAEAAEVALDDYYLVEVEVEDDLLLAPGPVAFPVLPEGAEDLPHIVPFDGRSVARETLADALVERLRADAMAAMRDHDYDRVADLVDLTYDAEAWAPVELDDLREHLASVAGE